MFIKATFFFLLQNKRIRVSKNARLAFHEILLFHLRTVFDIKMLILSERTKTDSNTHISKLHINLEHVLCNTKDKIKATSCI